jgi:hypothetical protein
VTLPSKKTQLMPSAPGQGRGASAASGADRAQGAGRSTRPVVEAAVRRVVKHGNADDEMEDACRLDVARGRFAIADGATESSFADLWARLLVCGFVAQPPGLTPDWETWLPELQQAWQSDVGARSLPWYAADKAAIGGFSTLLGLVLENDHRWYGLAVGDSCLFQVRGKRLVVAFPVSRAADFNLRPPLIGSRRPGAELRRDGMARVVTGQWRVRDRFFLMTDALACWLLKQTSRQRIAPAALALLLDSDHDAFDRQIQTLRDQGALKNDDVTLVHLQVTGTTSD